MQTDSKHIAELVESGDYFKQSRDWYEALYIGPIPERTFFVVIAALAGMVAFIGFLAVMAFLPLTDHPPVFLRSNRIDEKIPRAVSLKSDGVTLNGALLHFFLRSYVSKREGYTAATYPANYNFIRAQSDTPTFQDYNARYGPGNPNSPASLLKQSGKRLVQIQSMTINTAVEPKTAVIQFTTDLAGLGETIRTHWTATLQFYYTDLVVLHTIDPKTGIETLQTQDPQFKVVTYALTQAP